MKVHLISSLRNFDEDIKVLREITKVLSEHGAFVAQNWFEGVYDRKQRGIAAEGSLDWDEIVETNVRAVRESDVLIIEGSRFNYSQGFQTALALEYNKPVLNLYREDLPEYREWPDKFFVSGITDSLFTSRAYKNEDDLQKIVAEFLKKHTIKLHELDMKLTLDTKSYDQVMLIAHDEGRSQTSVIKDMVMKGLKTD